MSVDYRAVGGLGLRITSAIMDKAVKKGDTSEDIGEWLDDAGVDYETAGNAWSSDADAETEFFLMMPQKTLVDAYAKAGGWVQKINDVLSTNFTVKDIETISELRIS